MEVKINQVVLHLLDPGASEPVLSDRAMDMDADLYEYYTATLERAFASDEVKNCRFLPDSLCWTEHLSFLPVPSLPVPLWQSVSLSVLQARIPPALLFFL